MKNLFYVVSEVFYSYTRMIQSYGAMFRDMAPELEFFRWKDYSTLCPKMFSSDVPLFPDSGST